MSGKQDTFIDSGRRRPFWGGVMSWGMKVENDSHPKALETGILGRGNKIIQGSWGLKELAKVEELEGYWAEEKWRGKEHQIRLKRRPGAKLDRPCKLWQGVCVSFSVQREAIGKGSKWLNESSSIWQNWGGESLLSILPRKLWPNFSTDFSFSLQNFPLLSG